MKIIAVVPMLLFCVLGPQARADEPAATKPLPKPPTVTREQWGSQPQPLPDSTKHTPKLITIHHAGTDWKSGKDAAKFVKAVQEYGQKEKNWPDLPYHFMIAPDGRIFEARPIEYAPQSNTKYDLPGHIGVELFGNFENQRPSEAQVKSCVALSAWLCQEYKLDPGEIAGHKDRAKGQTVCPGKDFYRYLEDGQFVKWVRQALGGESPNIKLGPPLPGGPTEPIPMPADAKDVKN